MKDVFFDFPAIDFVTYYWGDRVGESAGIGPWYMVGPKRNDELWGRERDSGLQHQSHSCHAQNER